MNNYIFLINRTRKEYFPIEEKYYNRLLDILKIIKRVHPEYLFTIEEVDAQTWNDYAGGLPKEYGDYKKTHFIDWEKAEVQ